MKALWLPTLVLTLAVVSCPGYAQTTYTDGDFSTGWSPFQYDSGDNVSYVETRYSSGGNPNAFREISYNIGTTTRRPAQLFAGNLKWSYVPPGFPQQISSIDVEIDWNPDASGPPNGISVDPVIKQNGKFYISVKGWTGTTGYGWGTFTQTGLVATDFVEVDTSNFTTDSASHPVFTPPGLTLPTIQLGYGTLNSIGENELGYFFVGGIDNVKFVVHN